jgi:hypothetical protein
VWRSLRRDEFDGAGDKPAFVYLAAFDVQQIALTQRREELRWRAKLTPTLERGIRCQRHRQRLTVLDAYAAERLDANTRHPQPALPLRAPAVPAIMFAVRAVSVSVRNAVHSLNSVPT